MPNSLETVLRSARQPLARGPVPVLDELHGSYRLRFARGPEDLEAVCRLRFEVFNLELGEGLEESLATGVDRDPFDEQCQHLLVLEESSAAVIGTYRLQVREVAEAARGFYSATEYDLSCFGEAFLSDAVELGRACIAREHRKRMVLFLLWRGLAAYALWHGRRNLFGCSSLTSQDPQEGWRAHAWFAAQGHLDARYQVEPLPGYQCPPPRRPTSGEGFEPPTLLASYLRYGARIASPPAIDRFFGTIDFLTVLDLAALDPAVFGLFAKGLDR